jgi:pyridoxal 5'-phosphate synthase pdxT subunit
MTVIGVLALQGGVEPHLQLLRKLGFDARPVRSAETLSSAAGLVLPGGESTAQRMLLAGAGLEGAIDRFVQSGRPVLATCAGLIIAALRGYLDVEVERNAYGPQLNSCEAVLDDGAHRMTFIRAPAIRALGAGVEVIARFRGEPVVVVQRSVIATNGHPELVGDGWLHERAFRTAIGRAA